MPFKSKDFRFDHLGVELNAPVDALRPRRAVIMQNWLSLVDGSLTPRPGLGAGVDMTLLDDDPVHSIIRLNDSSSGTTVSAIIVGHGENVSTVNTDFTSPLLRDVTYSRNPLSMVIHRPDQSTQPWAVLADSLKMRKVRVTGQVKDVGLDPPTTIASVSIVQPQYKAVDEMNDHTLWTAGGTAGAKANHTRIDAATRTITAILYDTGTTGWACVRPSSMANIGEGCRLTINAAETATVETVRRGSVSTTIASIIYEAGTTGPCSIHLATPTDDIDVDTLVQIAAAEYVRVLSVHRTVDGQLSFRCVTASNRVVGNSVQAFPAFRAYFTANHVAGESIGAIAVEFQVTAGVGHISHTIALDLSLIAAGLPTHPEDRIHIDVYVDKPELLSEIKFFWDVNNGTHNFDENYFFHTLRSNDLTPLTKDEQTLVDSARVREQRILTERRDQAEPMGGRQFGAFSDQLGRAKDKQDEETRQRQLDTGQNQWTSSEWSISEMMTPGFGRSGTDFSRGLTDVAAIRVSVIATGTVIVRVDGWWIGGGYGPDVSGTDTGLVFSARGRDSTTGAVSNLGPPTRGPIMPKRQAVNLSITHLPQTDCNKVDWFVTGGPFNGWFFIGSSDNGTPATYTYTETVEELIYRGAALTGDGLRDHFRPWPVRSLPISGTCNASGTIFELLTGTISSALAPGTYVRIGGKDYLYLRRISASKHELFTSAGSQSNVSWEMPEPILQAQKMHGFAGPFHDFYFGWGDPLNPGILYRTNGNDPDSVHGDGWDEICHPGEIIQTVVVTHDMCVVLTTEHAFAVHPAFTLNDIGPGLFTYTKLPSPSGCVGRWAACEAAGDVFWLGEDGIYASTGGEPQLITKDVQPLFPRGGAAGAMTNGMFPVDYAQEAALRLSYANGILYFDYMDTNGARRTIINQISDPDGEFGWKPLVYTPGVLCHYAEEGRAITTVLAGGANGRLFRLARNTADFGGAAIDLDLQVGSFDCGDSALRKNFGDMVLNYDTDGGALVLTPGFDDHSVTIPTSNLNEVSGRRTRRIDVDSGRGQRGRNISLRFVGSVTTQRPVLYWWRPNWEETRPETTQQRADDYQPMPNPGAGGAMLVRGIRIVGDTFGVARSALLEYTLDDGTIASLVISGINQSTMTPRYYPLPAPSTVYMSAARLRANDANTWELVGFTIDGDPAPPKSTQPTPPENPAGAGHTEARFVQGVRFVVDTENASTDVRIRVDENVLQTTINAANNEGPVIANGRAIVSRSFDVPFITHLISAEPVTAWRLFAVEWISEPEPELANFWKTQQTSHGLHGFQILGDGYLSVRSTDQLIFRVRADGVLYTAVFYDVNTNTGLARRKLRYRFPSVKGKSFEYELLTATSAGRVACYKKDCAQEVKDWGSEGSWQLFNPMGDAHFESGAKI